eukprot:1344397-Prymnesium_polylepis.2
MDPIWATGVEHAAKALRSSHRSRAARGPLIFSSHLSGATVGVTRRAQRPLLKCTSRRGSPVRGCLTP